VEDGTSEEFGMMFDILLTMPDSFLTKACNKETPVH